MINDSEYISSNLVHRSGYVDTWIRGYVDTWIRGTTHNIQDYCKYSFNSYQQLTEEKPYSKKHKINTIFTNAKHLLPSRERGTT
jgi:hypothetical protein